jgi:exonuclease SbcC
MEILAIRTFNLASLEGFNEIQFNEEPLQSAGIFAITGATGSGKSTLLDAMCLALYNKTPRFIKAQENKVKIEDVSGDELTQSDQRAILRKGASEGYAEVDFKGKDNQKFRAKWYLRRAQNKPTGRLQNEVVSCTNLTLDTPFQGTKKEVLDKIEEAIGLSFEQFTKSVLLAQGDFATFLKAKADDKSDLLEKLTGTELFSAVSTKIFDKTTVEENKLKELESLKEGIILLSEEEEVQLKTNLEVQQKRVKNLEEEFAALKSKEGWFKTKDELELKIKGFLAEKEKVEKELADNQDRAVLLKKIKRVKADSVLWKQYSDCLEQLEIIEKEIFKARSDIQQQNEFSAKIGSTKSQKLEEKQKIEKDIAGAEPLIREAEKLDNDLIRLQNELAEAKELVVSENQIISENKNRVEALVNSKKQIENEISDIQNWKKKNQVYEQIALKKDLLLRSLGDLSKKSETIKKEETLLKESLEKLNAIDAELPKLTERIEVLNESKVEKERLILSLNKVLESKDLIQLNSSILLQEKKLDSIDEFKQKINAFLQKQAEQNRENEKITSLNERLVFISEKATALSYIIKINKAEEQLLTRQIEKQKLANNKSVEELRNHLVEGEECPVCGSTEHPYLNRELTPFLNLITENEGELNTLRQKISKLEQEKEAFLMEHSEKKGALESTETNLERLNEEMQLLKRDLAQNKLNLSFNDNETSKSLEHLLSLKTDLEERINSEKSLWNDLNSKNEERNLLNEALNKIREELSELVPKERGLTEKIEAGRKDLKRIEDSLSSLKKEIKEESDKLSPYFTSNDWFLRFRVEPTQFLQKIEGFAQQWDDKLKLLSANEKAINELNPKISASTAELSKLNENLERYVGKESKLASALKETKARRTLIFRGEPVELVRNTLKSNLEKVLGALKDLDEEEKRINQLLASQQRLKEDKEQRKEKLENQKLAFTSQIEDWTNEFNQEFGANDSLKQFLEWNLTSNEILQEEEAFFNTLNTKLNEIRALLKSAELDFIKHSETKEWTENLDEVIEQIQRSIEAKNIESEGALECKTRLHNHEKNKEQQLDLLEKIAVQTKITEEWQKLNDLIGSRDGKKFKKIAQEYTLDILLTYANAQLEMLSKRYALERTPESLGLQVIDFDMGNEIRSVHSLSGGESFLVSLALALGLASLSSNKVKVESLFIDEGFGTLDLDTLMVAVDALERLRDQGRKVGVISHVQELTERVAVQIKVNRIGNTKSSLEVVGV